MRKKMISALRYVIVLSFISLAHLYACPVPASGAPVAQTPPVLRGTAYKLEISKILPVLTEKIHDRKLLEKSKEKIYSMDDGEVKLVAALCEKISDGGDSISSDIAFLLVTALIVLS